MKIVITSQGKDLTSQIDPRFGRAKWLIAFDTETGDFQAHDNELNLNAAQGAGIQTGINVVELNADAVITGNVGPKAFRTLSAGKVEIYLSDNQNAKDAIEAFKADKLKRVDNPNVQGHWM